MGDFDTSDDYAYDADDDDRIDELEQRIEQLESLAADGHGGSEVGISLGYAMGLALAIVLSWSRNASILWCILHGLFSWAYVIYFAATK